MRDAIRCPVLCKYRELHRSHANLLPRDLRPASSHTRSEVRLHDARNDAEHVEVELQRLAAAALCVLSDEATKLLSKLVVDVRVEEAFTLAREPVGLRS